MRGALVAILALLAVTAFAGTHPGGDTGGSSPTEGEVYPPLNDWGSPWYIHQPEESCCSESSCAALSASSGVYKRWMPDRLLRVAGTVISVSAIEWNILDTGVEVPATTSSCVALAVTGGKKTGHTSAAYVANIQSLAKERGLPTPAFFRSHRFEDIVAPQMVLGDAASGLLSPQRQWVLRSDRDWDVFLAWHAGDNSLVAANACIGSAPCCYSHCRAPNDDTVDCAFDYDAANLEVAGQPGNDGGCDDIDQLPDPIPEYAWTLATNLRGKRTGGDPNPEETANYVTFYRGNSDWRAPVAILGDLTNDDYVEWAADYFWATIERERELYGAQYIGPRIGLKDHFFTTSGESDVEHWIDMGDGLGGDAVVDTLAEAAAEADFYAGPPEIFEGYGNCDSGDATYNATGAVAGCRFTWPYYAYGMYKMAKALRGHVPQIPSLLIAKAIHFRGCPLTYRNAPPYTAAGCDDLFDDSTTVTSECTALGTPHPACLGANACELDCNEQAMWRAMYQYAGYIMVDLQGRAPEERVTDGPPSPVEGGIGSLGEGITFSQLATMLYGGEPIALWVRPIDTNAGYASPPVLGRDREETNPGTALADPNVVTMPEDPETTVTAAFTVDATQGATCVAPCSVRFDARTTDDTDHDNEFHTHRFAWDFGDSTGSWTTGSAATSRNSDEGPIVGHIYYLPGTYDVSLVVTAPDGDMDTEIGTVTVTDPDTEFATTDTCCVADSGGGFTGCPSGATQITQATDDFDQALTATVASGNGCDADARKVRVLFEGGATFTGSTTATLYNGDSAPGLIGSYGTGNALVETAATDTAAVEFGTGWTMTGLTINSNNTGSSHSPLEIPDVDWSGVSIIGNTITDLYYYALSVASSTGTSMDSDLAFADNVTTTNAAATSNCGGAFTRASDQVVIGNDIDCNYAGQYPYRSVHLETSAIAHNTFRKIAAAQNAIQIRAWARASGSGPAIEASQWNVVADNKMGVRSLGAPFINLCESNLCGTVTGALGVIDLLVQRNFAYFETGGSPSAAVGFIGSSSASGGSQYITVRNNIFDAQGSSDSGTTWRFVQVGPSPTGISSDGWHVLNNTFYATGSGTSGMDFCSGTVTSSRCNGNLADVRITGTKSASNGAGWAASSANVFASSNPFASTPGAQAATTKADFALSSGSAARNAGHDYQSPSADFYVKDDFDGNCRPDATEWDAGADEYGAAACP